MGGPQALRVALWLARRGQARGLQKMSAGLMAMHEEGAGTGAGRGWVKCIHVCVRVR